jgi:hypothetical protein
VLSQVFKDHFEQRRMEHVLVVTDGEPDSKSNVIQVLVSGINQLSSDKELGITFMQVGCNEQAADFLHELQDCLTEKGAKYNIVDCITHRDYDGKKLCQIIHQHLKEKRHS